MEVDLVYTWVTGEDPDYIKVCRSYAENPEDINPERYRDIYHFMKYSLRSVEKYLDWYRNIYIVTARPQVPEWLKMDHPRIKLVHHDQMVDPQFLPTFNQNCFESFFHQIPGIADHFVYINDDFLFGSQTNLSDFYNDGVYTIFNTVLGENLGWRIYDGKNDVVGFGMIEHTPLFINKVFWKEMTELFPEKQLQSRTNKFRQKSDLLTYKLYRYYMLKYQRKISKPIHLRDLLKVNTFHKVTNDFEKQQRAFERLESKAPKYYCLNDDQRDNPNEKVVELVKDFLARNYPEKSQFEI